MTSKSEYISFTNAIISRFARDESGHKNTPGRSLTGGI